MTAIVNSPRHSTMPLEALGYLPEIFAPSPLSAAEAAQQNYAYGGGWRPFPGFSFEADPDYPEFKILQYPGDPIYYEIAHWKRGEETIRVFHYSWVVIEQADGSWEASRMD